jgi:hypothetical protein
MRTLSRSRIIAALSGAALYLPIALLAQSQDTQSSQSTSQSSSVADAARQSREKKKNPSTSPKSRKVITDDDLDRGNFQPGQEGLDVGASPKLETGPPSARAVAAAEAADNAADQEALREATEQDAEIDRLKVQVTEAERDLDLARRQLSLDQDTYLANPDYAHNVSGKAKLAAEKQLIDDKQQEIERLKTRLAALEELKGHRRPARTHAAPPSQTETAPPGEKPAQTEKPAEAEKPPSAPPRY